MSDVGWFALLLITPLVCGTVLFVTLIVAAIIMDRRDHD